MNNKVNETMYERIKRMSKEEMKRFIHMVYLCGNKDGFMQLQDSESGYFGGYVIELDRNSLMPNDNVEDLYEAWEL